jgi:2'-5' RNA ligase
VRLFVAVRLPDEVRRALGAAIDQLRTVARGVSWVASENLHITLKFLGEVDAGIVESLDSALAGAATGVPAFPLEVRGLGAFPTAKRPRVVWAGIGAGAEPLAALAGRVNAALARLRFPPDDRPFSGHITLGRVREPQRDQALASALEHAGDRVFGRLAVADVVLVRSDLSPNGARHTPVQAFPLADRLPG